MNNSPRPKKNTRNSSKCSACRQRKKKCSPHDRDWENSQQKCEFCEEHNLPCGPNVRYSNDSANIRRRTAVPEDEHPMESSQASERPRVNLDESATSSAQNIPPLTTRRVQERNYAPPDPDGYEDRGQLFGTSSVEALSEKAKSKLHDFHALGNTLSYVSQPSIAYCHAHGSQQPYHDLSLEEKLHELFLEIYRIAAEANDLNEPHMARWILLALVSALDQYPRLLDSRKRHILLNIARMFQELGHQWDYERVLLKILKIASIHRELELSSSFDLLAKSFSTSSNSIRRVLVDRWNETVGGNHIDADPNDAPPHLNVPPLHTAVRHRQPRIVEPLLPNPNDFGSSQLASSPTMSSGGARMKATEERDLNHWTPLFAAVAFGDENCCLALLINGAKANTRDPFGHSALEVAVRGGNFNIVKHLIEYGADLNPNITGCSSWPLYAAIEAGNPQFDIINLLLDSNARVDLVRYTDRKTALDLAVDRGYYKLAERISHMVANLEPTPFMTRNQPLSYFATSPWAPSSPRPEAGRASLSPHY